MANKYPNVTPGEIVPGGATYLNNAEVRGGNLSLKDANGNEITGRQVDNGDSIIVLDVSYSKQLCLIQYSTPSGIRQGYVTNDTNIIQYSNQGQWRNGSSTEIVYDENDNELGSLDPNEIATPLYKVNGKTHVVYNTNKGLNTKSGYVIYEGSKAEIISIPDITVPGVEKREYGKSGQGRPLIVHKIGNGSKALVMVCEVHGFEDNWNKDGLELVNIGHDVIRSLASNGTNGWSVYVIPAANPDGLSEGYTNMGPGRCTIVGHVDINRDFPIGFSAHGTQRCWSGDRPLSVNESERLSNLLLEIKAKHTDEMVVIDLHGWEGSAIGDSEIGQYFTNQFGTNQLGYGKDQGYLITWTKKTLGAKSALIELPSNTHSHNDVVNGAYSQKVINAVTNLLNSSGGSNGWVQRENKWYYYENGSIVTGWKQISGVWYIFESNGVMITGWKKVGDDWYYLQVNGAMAIGWLTLENNKYYLNGSGHMVTGENIIDGIRYTFDSSGCLVSSTPNGWVQKENKWYYYENGSIVTGWKQISGVWYIFESNGVMITGWKKVGDDWYYLYDNGAMGIGWLTLGNNKYYLNGSGHMVTGENIIDGIKYTFDSSGTLISNNSLICELLVASGQEGGEEEKRFKYNFIETAIKQIKDFKESYGTNKFLITWLIDRGSYSPVDVENFIKTAAKLDGVKIQFVNSKQQFINYINTQSIDDSKKRLLKIKEFALFGHGHQGVLNFGFDYDITKDDLSKIDWKLFEVNNFSHFYSCNTATGSTESFASAWCHLTQGTVTACVNRTSYRYVSMDEFNLAQHKIVEGLRLLTGYLESGAYRYPVPAKDDNGYWVEFKL